jgi:hypothetical protein
MTNSGYITGLVPSDDDSRQIINNTHYNSDGLIKCLRQSGQLQSQPLKSMREKFEPFMKFCATRQFRLPGQSLLRVGG